MQQSRTLWLWMIIPMVVMQSSIFVDYWGDFVANTWAVHVHYWIVTLWYLFLITQPWLVTHGRMDRHRTWGMIGLFIAGAVAFTSISQLNRDVVYANFVRDHPGGIGPFEPSFFFTVMLTEIVLISAFIVAVMMAIIQRKSTNDHAWWLVSTLFILMFPALARGLQAIAIAVYGFTPETDIVVMPPLYASQIVILVMFIGFAARFNNLRHAATLVGVGANAAFFMMEPLAKMDSVQAMLRALVKA